MIPNTPIERAIVELNGHNLNRDWNAALNIKKFGLRASTLNVKTDH